MFYYSGGTEFDEFLAEAKADAYEYYNGVLLLSFLLAFLPVSCGLLHQAEWFAKSKWGSFKRYSSTSLPGLRCLEADCGAFCTDTSLMMAPSSFG
jgi:hypothetical protein